MILTPDHHEAHLYLATRGSEPLTRLVRLDTETGAYTQLTPEGFVEGVCDRLFKVSMPACSTADHGNKKAGTLEWERLPLAARPL